MGVFSPSINNQEVSNKGFSYWFKNIGHSILFSSAAIGVSHVMQATRAGAGYSLLLLPLVLLCLVLKYPAFLIGPLYPSVFNESVITGYKKLSSWFLILVGLCFIPIAYTVVAAVSMLTSAILIESLALTISPTVLSIALIIFSSTLIYFFKFDLFQKKMKWVVVFLTVSTLLAFLLSLVQAGPSAFTFSPLSRSLNKTDFVFIAALIGWMPAGMDLPMMHSNWALASKNKKQPTQAWGEFNLGYLSTGFLAVIFLLIGAVCFFNQNITIKAGALGFADQILSIYTSQFGALGKLVIGSTLFLALYSSLIVVIDGFSKVLGDISKDLNLVKADHKKHLLIQGLGAILIILFFKSSLKNLVDFATTVSFLLAPVFSYLNHKLLIKCSYKTRISKNIIILSFIGVMTFTLITLFYLYLKFMN